MLWYEILLVGLLLVGIVAVWIAVYGKKDSPVGCVGCGKCAVSGECVFVKEQAEKRAKTAKKGENLS